MRYLQNGFSDAAMKKTKIQKNFLKSLNKSCPQTHAKIMVSNKFKHKIFAKYCFNHNSPVAKSLTEGHQ